MDLFLLASGHVDRECGQTNLALLAMTTDHQMVVVEVTDTTFEICIPSSYLARLRHRLKQHVKKQQVKLTIREAITHSDKKEIQEIFVSEIPRTTFCWFSSIYYTELSITQHKNKLFHTWKTLNY